MVSARDCDGEIFLPPSIISIPPGFHVESLTISVPVTRRTVGSGSTLNPAPGLPPISNTPASLTRRNPEICTVLILMFEDRTSHADDVVQMN